MNYPEVTPEEQRDIDDVKLLLKALNDGWSVSAALGKAKLSPQRYTELRRKYPSVAEIAGQYKQTYKRKFPYG